MQWWCLVCSFYFLSLLKYDVFKVRQVSYLFVTWVVLLNCLTYEGVKVKIYLK
jgi:hypothetical protein